MATAHRGDRPKEEIQLLARELRAELNPHPAGQMQMNIPLDTVGEPLNGLQHKYRETVLFFPSQGQACHSYCTFCFRWAEFVGDKELRMASTEATRLHAYLQQHHEVTDLPSRLVEAGKHVAIMAHYNHWREPSTDIARQAIRRLRETGTEIRSQGPLLARINDNADDWARLWKTQVRLGIIPYYRFVERDTGARHCFEVPLAKAWEVYRGAMRQVSGLGRTARGPSMSAGPGKVEVQGITEIAGEKVFVLRFVQGRNPDWVQRPFFARYDDQATWLDQLQPAFGEHEFFFEAEFRRMQQTFGTDRPERG